MTKWEYLWLNEFTKQLISDAKNLDEIKSEIEKNWKDVEVEKSDSRVLITSLNPLFLMDILGSMSWELTSSYVEGGVKVRHIFKRQVS